MQVDYIHRFITSMVFTTSIETLTLVLLLAYVFKKHSSKISDVIVAGFFASFMTIPYVWFVFPYLTHWTRSTSFLVSEPTVFLIEAIFYNRYLKVNIKTAFVLSFICNLVSYFVGPLLRTYGLWIYW